MLPVSKVHKNFFSIMKTLLTILLFLTSIISYGQSCDTINGKVVNCIDSNGLKQGFWENGLYTFQGQYGFSEQGFCQGETLRTRVMVVASGSYRNNKKVGVWQYFANHGHGSITEMQITYHENGATTEYNYIENYELDISSDSTSVSGRIYYMRDTINISCYNNKGLFKLYPDKVICVFDCPDFDTFDYEFSRLKYGKYDQEIKLAKLEYKEK
jgi:hypothetical protein